MRKHRKNKAKMNEELVSADALGKAASDQEASTDDQAADPAGEPGKGASELEEALKEAQDDLNRHRDAMLRMQAEMDNQRKRLVREAEKSRKFALERMMKDLLQVHDSLERGLEVDAESATVDGLREGEALTLKMFAKVLQEHGLEIVDPLGETFNPEFHEAMTMAPSDEYAENIVMEVLQKGFSLHDRLIRPAMVVVSRGSQ